MHFFFNIWWFQLLQHLNRVNITTPQGEMFHFQGADIPAKYDLVNWQKTPEGSLKLVLIGRVDGFDLHLNESAIQWSTGSNQVVTITSCVKASKNYLLQWLSGFLSRFLFQCAVRAAPRVPEGPTGKENLSAAMTVSHVLKGRLAIQLVRKSLQQKLMMVTLISPKVVYFRSFFSCHSYRFSSLWALSIWVLVQCGTNSLCPSSAGLSFL